MFAAAMRKMGVKKGDRVVGGLFLGLSWCGGGRGGSYGRLREWFGRNEVESCQIIHGLVCTCAAKNRPRRKIIESDWLEGAGQ